MYTVSMELINKYLQAHRPYWRESTFKSETSRISTLPPKLVPHPDQLFSYLEDKGSTPYSIKTTFMRLRKMYDWAKVNPNPYAEFFKEKGFYFRNAYQREKLTVTYQEALRLIERLEPKVRDKAKEILTSGLRISEAFKDQDTMEIKGKGGKIRPFFGEKRVQCDMSKRSFARHLKRVGLKPHTLRKLFVTELVNKGVALHDVMYIAGWESLETAKSYLQNKTEKELRAQIKEVISG